MEPNTSALRASLGFTRVEDVSPGGERRGLLRARTLPFGVYPDEAFDFRSCVLNDCADPQAPATIRDEERISDASAEALRASLNGARFRLSSGAKPRIEHVAVRMLGNVTGCPVENLRIGMRVEAYAVECGDGMAVPFWRPSERSAW